ncbi:hypothetical protein HYH02_001130 [Chlamydomonas schloesseri]|uniref:N-acetyltransferase domain-containing protein n=1 Tax=Chlamydomonas schloesseri TaxID=2026947 RepID=A0A835WUS8_9CHLO|nr:hypothetical protein HYH02_001130 [Chlamydomonas schloesseri]|eukprot:KAG2454090.1 hypothetical protein HYH02_001130 [Chlamydomonas schloesseri]
MVGGDDGNPFVGVFVAPSAALLRGSLAELPATVAGLWQQHTLSLTALAHSGSASSPLPPSPAPPPPSACMGCGRRAAALPWAATSLGLLAGLGPAAPGHRAADKGGTTRHVCAGCHQHLSASDLARLGADQDQHPHHPHAPPGAVLQCDGCHRCFHGRCHRRWASAAEQERRRRARLHAAEGGGREGAKRRHQDPAVAAAAAAATGAAAGGDWDEEGACSSSSSSYSSSSSSSSGNNPTPTPPSGAAGASPATTTAAAAAAAPPAATTPSHTQPSQPPQRLRMRVYDCGDTGPAAAVGLRRVHGVLRAAGFGYGLGDLRQFDMAALLLAEVGAEVWGGGRLPDSGQALSAAVLDVYGSHFAELYLLATCAPVQRRGYGRALVRQLESSLAEAGVRRLLVSVDDDDGVNQDIWRRALGFEPVADVELKELGRSWGAFGPTARSGTVFLCRRLLGTDGEGLGQGVDAGKMQAQAARVQGKR